jgi:hypothetical protein
MNLSEFYEKEGFDGLKRLADAAGTDPQWLRQCATRWRNRRPSPDLAMRLVKADPRLDFQSILIASNE